MNLEPVFARAQAQGRCALIPYVMAGDPDIPTTLLLLASLASAGADIIELGIPYGDPLADGPTIAAAAQRALTRGTDIEAVLACARRSLVPVVLFTYLNPVLQYGLTRFCREAREAGVAGAIIPDVSLEESTHVRGVFLAHGLDMPMLVAPTTPIQRAGQIAQASTGFVYVVSRLGVTGAASTPNFEPVRAQLHALRGMTKTPLAVGFGVSSSQHVREIAPACDGIIVGSALLDAYADSAGAQAAERAARFITTLSCGISSNVAGRMVRSDGDT